MLQKDPDASTNLLEHYGCDCPTADNWIGAHDYDADLTANYFFIWALAQAASTNILAESTPEAKFKNDKLENT